MTRSEVLVGVAALVVCPIVAAVAALGGKASLLGIVALMALLVGVYIGLRHPLWLYWGTAIVIAALPFGYFPGVHVPLYLPLAAGALLAALIHPTAEHRSPPLAKAVLFLVLISGISVIFTYSSLANILDYTKWAVATSTFFALLALPREHLAKFGRIYVYAATFSALIGIAAVGLGSNRLVLKPFKLFGYAIDDTERYFFTGDKASFTRLGGMWLDPNAAGIGLLVAFTVSMILLAGRRRIVVASIILVAIGLTLSRSGMLSLLVGVILVLLFHNLRSRDRQIIVASLTCAFTVALLVPSTRIRLLSSFGSEDRGATDRWAAIKEWPGRMSGHWLFGRGWSQREFKDGAYAFVQNFVSNAPLITVHRAGVFVGLAFVAMIAVGCMMAFRLIRSNSLPCAIYGATFISFSLIALNLDHPVVIIPQITFLYTVFLTFLVYADELSKEPPPTAPKTPDVFDTSEITAHARAASV